MPKTREACDACSKNLEEEQLADLTSENAVTGGRRGSVLPLLLLTEVRSQPPWLVLRRVVVAGGNRYTCTVQQSYL